MTKWFSSPLISRFTAEFLDRKIEKDFEKREIEHIKKYSSFSVLIYGLIYFIFIITDYILRVDLLEFLMLAINRFFILIISIILFNIIKKLNDYTLYTKLINIYLIIAFVLFDLAYCTYKEKTFLIQTLGAILVIMAVFTLPNKFINSFLLASTFSVSYLLVSRFFSKPFELYNYIAATVYILMFNIVGSIISYKSNRVSRLNFYSNLQLFKTSITDPLTSIYNRLRLDDEIRKHLKLAKEKKEKLSIILFDIDNFKYVNDNYGHLTGDRVLVSLTNVVKRCISPNHIFARWGGDEFAILLIDVDKNEAIEIAKKISHETERVLKMINKDISCSFGVAVYHEEDDINTFIKRADDLLYKAKQKGKNMVCW
ncbi:GGDEF domain-containing protein [Caldicellulosiruptoraceae bacterium PP1]